jgi:hypothetical protein
MRAVRPISAETHPIQVPILWPEIFETGHEIAFAHTSFKWANLASHKAGVTVVIVGLSNHAGKLRRLFSVPDDGEVVVKDVPNINGYLIAGANIEVHPVAKVPDDRSPMQFGNHTYYGVDLLIPRADASAMVKLRHAAKLTQFLRAYLRLSLKFISMACHASVPLDFGMMTSKLMTHA